MGEDLPRRLKPAASVPADKPMKEPPAAKEAIYAATVAAKQKLFGGAQIKARTDASTIKKKNRVVRIKRIVTGRVHDDPSRPDDA